MKRTNRPCSLVISIHIAVAGALAAGQSASLAQNTSTQPAAAQLINFIRNLVGCGSLNA